MDCNSGQFALASHNWATRIDDPIDQSSTPAVPVQPVAYQPVSDNIGIGRSQHKQKNIDTKNEQLSDTDRQKSTAVRYRHRYRPGLGLVTGGKKNKQQQWHPFSWALGMIWLFILTCDDWPFLCSHVIYFSSPVHSSSSVAGRQVDRQTWPVVTRVKVGCDLNIKSRLTVI